MLTGSNARRPSQQPAMGLRPGMHQGHQPTLHRARQEARGVGLGAARRSAMRMLLLLLQVLRVLLPRVLLLLLLLEVVLHD
jgi:hypothetical protein